MSIDGRLWVFIAAPAASAAWHTEWIRFVATLNEWDSWCSNQIKIQKSMNHQLRWFQWYLIIIQIQIRIDKLWTWTNAFLASLEFAIPEILTSLRIVLFVIRACFHESLENAKVKLSQFLHQFSGRNRFGLLNANCNGNIFNRFLIFIQRKIAEHCFDSCFVQIARFINLRHCEWIQCFFF